jgi:soluble lytic murein transglycosylase
MTNRFEILIDLLLHLYHLLYFKYERCFCISGQVAAVFSFVFVFLMNVTACSTGSPKAPSSTESRVIRPTDFEAADKIEASLRPVPKDNVSAALVGRALELGDLKKAESLASLLKTSPEELLVKARLAEALGDDETAVRMFHDLTDALPEFESIRIRLLAEALARLGRTDEAAEQLGALVKTDHSLGKEERFTLQLKMAKWLFDSKKNKEAKKILDQAQKNAPNPASGDRAILASIPILLIENKAKEAATLLDAVVSKPSSKENLLASLSLLKDQTIPFRWTDERRLSIAKSLVDYRAYDTAEDLLKEMLKTPVSAKQQQEAKWLLATTLFNKRGHYKEALGALGPIAAGLGNHSDEAAFLAARALSRLDRDDEAIKAYRTYASKTKLKAKAAEARFLAARLEYYQGRHKQALAALERLVGNGVTSKKISALSASDARDAHFIAGMCAFSAKLPSRAEPHFARASDGTSDSEVLKRNEYWTAASKAQASKKGWEKALYAVCEKDPTDWYARMSAMRLEDAKQPLGPCDLIRAVHVEKESETQDGGVPADAPALGSEPQAADAAPKNIAPNRLTPIAELSKIAALYAKAGFYRDTADILHDVEKKGVVRLSPTEWIAQYNALDAPQYAISRASSLFQWPPEGNAQAIIDASYPRPYQPLVEDVELKMNLPDKLIFAIARKESLFDPKAVSRVGAMGLMQMMPGTYEANRKRAGLPPLKKGELPGPEDSVRAAGYEFKGLFEKFKSLPLAIMAYNAGEAAAARWVDRSSGMPLDVFIEKAGFAETRNYVRRVIKNLIRYRLIYGGQPLELPRMVERVVAPLKTEEKAQTEALDD